MDTTIICPRCGKEIDPGSQFCPFCGIAIPVDPDASMKVQGKTTKDTSIRKFRWLWLLSFWGILNVLDNVAGFALSLGFDVAPRSVQDLPGIVVFPISVIIVFLAGFATALLSPGKTLLEPAAGAAVYAIFTRLLNLDFLGVLLGWIAPFLFARAGATFGEYIAGRYQRKHENPGSGLRKDQQPRQSSTFAH